MINFLISLIISIFVSFGLAIALVEKGNEYPIRRYKLLLKQFIHDNINWKFCQVLDCTTCSSFWTTFISDLVILILFRNYFFWPFSGFITMGMTWTIIETLNIIENK